MSRARPGSPSSILRLATILVLVAACDVSTPSIRPDPSTVPTPSPTSIPTDDSRFRPVAYPIDGGAPCDEAKPPDSRHAAYQGEFRRITAKDATTIVFDLCVPDVAFLAKIAAPAFGISDTGWLQDRPTPLDGTGPYALERWTPGTEISLTRNETSWTPPADPERIIVRWDADAADRVTELQAGDVDGVDTVDAAGVADLTNDVSVSLAPRAGLNVLSLGFGTSDAPLAREQVRRAIALAIDRPRMVETLLPAGSAIASHVTPCEMPHGCAGDAWYGYDPTLARETLTAAGYPDGFTTTLHYPADASDGLSDLTAIADEIRTDLSENLGITLDLVAEPDGAYLASMESGDLGGLSLSTSDVTIPDVSAFLDSRFSGGAKDIGKALTAGASTADDDAREAAYTTANNAIRAHVTVVPLAHIGTMAAYRTDVLGATTSPLHLESFARVTPGDRRQFVWLTDSEPGGLYCADETDPTALLVCSQVVEGLYVYDPGSTQPIPRLAKGCKPNRDLTTWTCTLRDGITFQDGSRLEADDVALSFAIQWDADNRLRIGRTGAFETFKASFGGFLNPPAAGG